MNKIGIIATMAMLSYAVPSMGTPQDGVFRNWNYRDPAQSAKPAPPPVQFNPEEAAQGDPVKQAKLEAASVLIHHSSSYDEVCTPSLAGSFINSYNEQKQPQLQEVVDVPYMKEVHHGDGTLVCYALVELSGGRAVFGTITFSKSGARDGYKWEFTRL